MWGGGWWEGLGDSGHSRFLSPKQYTVIYKETGMYRPVSLRFVKQHD